MSAHDEAAARALMDGEALLEMGRPADAVAALSRSVAADPQNSLAYATLAVAELQLAHHEKAQSAAQEALALDAENEWAHRILARALTQLGEHRQAHQEALRAVELAPEAYQGYLVLAETLLNVGDFAGALEAANHAVRLAPEVSATHSTVALVKLRHEDWSGAERAAREALTLDAENAVAMNNLAVALGGQRRNREAVQVYEQAARVAPTHRTIRGNILRLRRTRAAKHLSDPTRTLIADDARARRYQPHRWDWQRAGRLRPWWWILLRRIRAPHALAINIALFVVSLGATLGARNHPLGWTIFLGLALPFSARRAWKWWRIRHPARTSWTPTDIEEPENG